MATDSNLMATVLDRLAYIYDDMQAWNKVWVTIINSTTSMVASVRCRARSSRYQQSTP